MQSIEMNLKATGLPNISHKSISSQFIKSLSHFSLWYCSLQIEVYVTNSLTYAGEYRTRAVRETTLSAPPYAFQQFMRRSVAFNDRTGTETE